MASTLKGSSVADRIGWNFAQLLDWHLTRGTRPKASPDAPGKQWTNAEFGHAVGTDERTVRNWRRGRNVPADIVGIERELFGENTAYVDWRIELREAHRPRPPPTVNPLRVSNIPIRVPMHFMGRDDALADIKAALKRNEARVAITALHGLRGVGKTTLAAAYAERHRGGYRATWWIRAQTETAMRADLAALGIRLGWVGADDKEEPAVAAVMERLRHEGEGILLIFDNATDAMRSSPTYRAAAPPRCWSRRMPMPGAELRRRSKSACGPRRSAPIT
jgi:hypothetical protein